MINGLFQNRIESTKMNPKIILHKNNVLLLTFNDKFPIGDIWSVNEMSRTSGRGQFEKENKNRWFCLTIQNSNKGILNVNGFDPWLRGGGTGINYGKCCSVKRNNSTRMN